MSLNLLTLPLSGRQVIEASAGTGKTFTLAALYVRLVLGHGRASKGLQPPQILVMTFTEAATAELRERIRHRLHETALWFDAQVTGKAETSDPFLQDLSAAFTPEQWPHCAAQRRFGPPAGAASIAPRSAAGLQSGRRRSPPQDRHAQSPQAAAP